MSACSIQCNVSDCVLMTTLLGYTSVEVEFIYLHSELYKMKVSCLSID